MDYLARTRGDSTVRKFVESSSAQLIPYLIDIPAKRAFGTTFTSAWREWEKEVYPEREGKGHPEREEKGHHERSEGSAFSPSVGWRELTTDGLSVSAPRWMGDSALTYTGTGGRDPYSEFAVSLDGKRTRLARRNSSSPTVVLPNGESLFSQLELTSPYSERSDLLVHRGNRQVRLTKNARLFSPDARSDGAIIATQIVNGTSRLVRVFPDAGQPMPITADAFDAPCTERRWWHS